MHELVSQLFHKTVSKICFSKSSHLYNNDESNMEKEWQSMRELLSELYLQPLILTML